MRTLPAELLKLIVVFQPLFTKPTWEHAKAVLLGALLPSWQTRCYDLSARGRLGRFPGPQPDRKDGYCFT